MIKENKLYIIPQITDPLGKYWNQPNQKDILVDEKYAVMNQSDFDKLANYSHSQPSGAYIGKMWKMNINSEITKKDRWYLCWFDKDSDPTFVSNNYREIILL